MTTSARDVFHLGFSVVVLGLISPALVSCGSPQGSHFDGLPDASISASTEGGSGTLQGSGGGVGSMCIPKTCADSGFTCGKNSDGCGAIADCGTCSASEFCGGGGYSKCGTTPSSLQDGGSNAGSLCAPKTCSDLGYDCGYGGDGCGNALNCGGSSACTLPQYCGGGGAQKCGGNVAIAPDGGVYTACVPKTCADLGSDCGSAGDGCGGALDCGGISACMSPEYCGGGGPNKCGGSVFVAADGGAINRCTPTTCAALGFTCGYAGDGCGNQLNCGGASACTSPEYCGGGGPNKCGGSVFVAADGGAVNLCTPTTCAALGATCGYAGDGCGNQLNCGGASACASPQYCGGGGPNKCGGSVFVAADGGAVNLCTPTTCAALGATCGYAGDGCGNQLNCGGASACTSPQYCGGGGPNKCGGSVFVAADGGAVNLCTPTTCAALGATCGYAGDGCGNQLNCGGASACTSPQYCGGGGPNKCGGSVFVAADGGAVNLCVSTSCPQLGFDCGYAGDGCGNLLNCGSSCPGAEYCGGGGANKCGGNVNVAPDGAAIHLCQPTTCAAQNLHCGQADDGCGNVLQCGTCTLPNSCGGAGTPGQCGHVCTGLCAYQAACDGGATTTITGTVAAAVSKWLNPQAPTTMPFPPDPVPNVLVYVPNTALSAMPQGYIANQCPLCGADVSGQPLVSTYTNFDGSFTLANVPTPPANVQTQIPVVIQLGRWRKEFLVNTPPTCATTSVGTLNLPANKTDGVPANKTGGVATTNIPLTGISTGSVDAMECVLLKMGLDPAEFTADSGTGRIHIYSGGTKPPSGAPGATVANATPETTLMNAANGTYMNYDQLMFPCWGAEVGKPAPELANLIAYADSGGHFFATHYSYSWLVNNGEFNNVAQWNPNYNNPGGVSWSLNVSKAPPLAPVPMHSGIFYQWLNLVGALSNGNPVGAPPASPLVSISNPRHDANGVANGSVDWIDGIDPQHTDAGANASLVEHFTFNTPVSQTNQCGHAIFSDFHVTNASSAGKTFPAECAAIGLTAQERILEYMVFDLASCVTPPTSICRPLTCLNQGLQCGVTGDGCGNPLDCGSCQSPLTCGGSGVRGVCGEPEGGACTPLTCGQQRVQCGPAGDGCGSQIQCGGCPTGQTCGGGGVAWQCGAPDGGACTPVSCTAQGLSCGPTGDGCGNPIQCGNCSTGQTCGGGGVSGQCGAPDGGACTPVSCSAQGLSCGPAGDGCGNPIQCGTCPTGQTCGGGGVRGQCGAPTGGACAPLTCAAQRIACGPAGDGCGNAVPCGSCSSGQACGGGGVFGQCGVPDAGACAPLTCTIQGIGCGPAGDGCGNPIQCGACPTGKTCGGGGASGQCGAPDGGACAPLTCSEQVIGCGPAGDGCGNAVDCGVCPEGQSCGGGGVSGQCGVPRTGQCVPQSCAQLNITCGPAGDGCGNLVQCGPCTAPQSCGGGGVPGQCGGGACVPFTCAQLGTNCGPAGDGCGGLLQCGGCSSPSTCGGGGRPGLCGTPAAPK